MSFRKPALCLEWKGKYPPRTRNSSALHLHDCVSTAFLLYRTRTIRRSEEVHECILSFEWIAPSHTTQELKIPDYHRSPCA